MSRSLQENVKETKRQYVGFSYLFISKDFNNNNKKNIKTNNIALEYVVF